MAKKILILGGGGCKGTLQIEVLKELEQNEKLNNIDLIIGSSVGAINGAILATNKLTATQLRNIYPDMIKYIFKKKPLPIPPIYDRNRFFEVWNIYIGNNVKLGNVQKKLVISTIDFCKKEPHFFKSWKPDDSQENMNIVVARSFAAPYYFGFLADPNTQRVYGDGGMGYDNLPISEALLETIGLNWFNEEIKFIIIGTGFVDITEQYKDVSKKGFIKQTLDFISPNDGGFCRASSRIKQLTHLKFICSKFNNVHFDYYDIQIPKELNGIDKTCYITEYQKYGLEASKKPLISI